MEISGDEYIAKSSIQCGDSVPHGWPVYAHCRALYLAIAGGCGSLGGFTERLHQTSDGFQDIQLCHSTCYCIPMERGLVVHRTDFWH